jgi:hypothetical protein
MKSGRRAGHPRAGVVLALFALLCQIVTSLLPMPAMADGFASFDGSPICRSFDTNRQVPTKPGKSSGHTLPDCPVCQALQLGASLVPPAPIALPPEPGLVHAVDFPTSGAIRPGSRTTSHQARAPPPSV